MTRSSDNNVERRTVNRITPAVGDCDSARRDIYIEVHKRSLGGLRSGRENTGSEYRDHYDNNGRQQDDADGFRLAAGRVSHVDSGRNAPHETVNRVCQQTHHRGCRTILVPTQKDAGV